MSVLKRLWAPWRLEYILDSKKKAARSNSSRAKSCVFCSVQKGKPNSSNLVLYRGESSYVIMNKFPYVNGHLMVIPNRHSADFTKLSVEEHVEMTNLISKSIAALRKIYEPHGFNVGMNLGRAAGAGIEEHLHYHIVPRWDGDHNFMPVLGETRVMQEYVKKTYERLRPLF